MDDSATKAIRRPDLERAAAGMMTTEQADAFRQRLGSTLAGRNSARLLGYAAALVILGLMGLAAAWAFARPGGWLLFAVALIDGLLLALAGDVLWRRGRHTQGGLLTTAAVAMAPLAIFGLQDAFGWARGSWLPMEVVTVAAGVIALRIYRFPLLVMPVVLASWLLTLDLVPWLLGKDWAGWEPGKVVSVGFALATLATAWVLDLRGRRGLAFWLHLFAAALFWFAVSLIQVKVAFAGALYLLINLAMLVLGLFLQRRAYALFGALGVAAYANHVSAGAFGFSLLYPLSLALVGAVIILASVVMFRRQEAIEDAMRRWLPRGLWSLRPAHPRTPGADGRKPVDS